MQNQDSFQNKKFVKKVTKINWIIAIVVSIFIGLITSLLMGGSLNRSLVSYLWNAGYSISLGLPLFANGYLFGWFEKRYINWIKSPVKSVFAALTLHLCYTSIVIFTVNWFWFIYGANFRDYGKSGRTAYDDNGKDNSLVFCGG